MGMILRIELIIIGDELLNGRISDLNGVFLAKFLHKRGIELSNITVCQDSKESIQEAIQIAINRSHIILTTGGLGPTEDDRSKMVMSEIFEKKISKNDLAEKITIDNYQRYGRQWIIDQNHYDKVPEDFNPLPNLNGLAPGLSYQIPNKSKKQWLFMAPGVPKEFYNMLENTFFPFIAEEYGLKNNLNEDSEFRQIAIRTFGVPEEKIFNQIAPNLWDDLSQIGKVSSLPQSTGVNIIISLDYSQYEETKFFDLKTIYHEKLQQVKSLVNKTDLKNSVWQFGDLSLAEKIIQLCQKKNLTFAFAESCTGGLASSKITDVPGSSESFLASYVTYSNEQKIKTLNVKESSIEKFGAVSIEVVEEMATSALKLTKCDYSIAWSGIAGPGGGSIEKPIGTLALSWAQKGMKPESTIIHSTGDRLSLKNRFADIGLLKLLIMLKSEA